MNALKRPEEDSPGVVVTEADNVMVIRLARPQVRNAVDFPTAQLIESALDRLDSTDALCCGVLAADGPVFCAGMDLKALARTGQRPVTAVRGGFGITKLPPVKPLIAAVQGPALGGGFEIALCCDIIVAAESAYFSLPEVNVGQVAGGGGVVRLPRRIPFHQAAELVLTGRRMTAVRAAALGLVSEVLPEANVLPAAMRLAAEIAAAAPLAVGISKQLLYSALDWPASELLDRQENLVDVVRQSNDAAEGARAFAQRRAPVWRGT
jgi:enoyl-CoA hydratase/carnithine racemase